MSDGIIQKVIKTYIDRNRRYSDDAYYGQLYENQAKEYEQLQQELIEEIKKRIKDLDSESYECKERFGKGYFGLTWVQMYYISLDLKTLIGDNE